MKHEYIYCISAIRKIAVGLLWLPFDINVLFCQYRYGGMGILALPSLEMPGVDMKRRVQKYQRWKDSTNIVIFHQNPQMMVEHAWS